MKAKTTRRALLLSVLSLLLCCSMLVGTTFAWFTDSVTSGRNTIVAGNLDVVLEYWDGDSYEEVTSTTKLFDDEALWEPGYTEVAYLKVSNAGSLALKYQLAVNVAGETLGKTKTGEDIVLSNHLQFKVVESENDLAGTYASREAAQAANATATKLQSYSSDVKPLDPKDGANDEDYVALIIYMPTTVDNKANHDGKNIPKIEMGVSLLATQQTAESDSFDNQYDKDSEFAITANDATSLRTALDQGGNIIVNGDMNATDTVDVPTWTNAPAEYVIDATWVNSMSGGNYILDQASKYGIVARVSAGETLSLSNMKVTANSQWPMYLANFGGEITIADMTVTAEAGAGVYPYGTGGTTTLDNVNVNQERLDGAYESTTPWAATAVACSNGHNLVINSGTYVGSKWAVYGYNSGSNITINGGTFKGEFAIQLDGVWSGTNKSVATINGGNFDGKIHLDWGTNVPELYINGGNFTNFAATVYGAAKLVITGGTFDADPSAYVATGYQVTNNGNGTWSVAP